MPIIALNPDSIQQHCNACGVQQELPFAQLAAGINRDGIIDPYVMALPVCPGCGASEFLIRTANPAELARIRPGSYSHLHHLLVDRLHFQLASQGRVIEGADQAELENLPRTDQELETWLPDGLLLPLDYC